MKSLRMNFQKKTIFGKTYKMAHGGMKESVTTAVIKRETQSLTKKSGLSSGNPVKRYSTSVMTLLNLFFNTNKLVSSVYLHII